jgi:hypothetical protein
VFVPADRPVDDSGVAVEKRETRGADATWLARRRVGRAV